MSKDRKEQFDQIKQDIHHIIEQFGDTIPSKAQPLIEETLAKMQADHLSLQEALGFTPAIMEVIYQHGYHFFQSGKYQDALLVFNLLHQLNPEDARFIFAIAGCHHYTKNYMEAATHYIAYELKDSQNPVPYFHLYDCFAKAGYPLIAQKALEEAFYLAGLQPKYAELKQKIQLELNHLNTLAENEREAIPQPSSD